MMPFYHERDIQKMMIHPLEFTPVDIILIQQGYDSRLSFLARQGSSQAKTTVK
jgi:hypothetical protein